VIDGSRRYCPGAILNGLRTDDWHNLHHISDLPLHTADCSRQYLSKMNLAAIDLPKERLDDRIGAGRADNRQVRCSTMPGRQQ
jgi:hypothetical protein